MSKGNNRNKPTQDMSISRTRASCRIGFYGKRRSREPRKLIARPSCIVSFGLIASILIAAVVAPSGAQAPPIAAAAGQAAPQTLSDAVQVLAREQSVAEQYAVILDRFGKKDAARYVQGITRYAEAKAEFDGLIEALKTDLTEGRDPKSSPKLAEAMRVAAEKRIAFTSFVSDQVMGNEPGAKALLPTVIAAVPDLIKSLTDAGISIWKEYRTAGKERRDEIRDQLDHLKWKPFADLAKAYPEQ